MSLRVHPTTYTQGARFVQRPQLGVVKVSIRLDFVGAQQIDVTMMSNVRGKFLEEHFD